jgi:repressor LexA
LPDVRIMNDHYQENLNRVYDFIRRYKQEYGYPPSLREIAAACYLGRSTVLRYLDRLEIQGRLTRTSGVPRSIQLLDADLNE